MSAPFVYPESFKKAAQALLPRDHELHKKIEAGDPDIYRFVNENRLGRSLSWIPKEQIFAALKDEPFEGKSAQDNKKKVIEAFDYALKAEALLRQWREIREAQSPYHDEIPGYYT